MNAIFYEILVRAFTGVLRQGDIPFLPREVSR